MTDPRYPLTEQFLASCLPDSDIVTFVQVCLSAGIIMRDRLEAVERNMHMLELVGKGVPRVTVAMRMGVSRKTLFKNLKEIQSARREALRKAG